MASTTLKIIASFQTSEFSTLRPILGSTLRLDYAQLVSARSREIEQGGGRRDHEEGGTHYQQGPDHRAARNSSGTRCPPHSRRFPDRSPRVAQWIPLAHSGRPSLSRSLPPPCDSCGLISELTTMFTKWARAHHNGCCTLPKLGHD